MKATELSNNFNTTEVMNTTNAVEAATINAQQATAARPNPWINVWGAHDFRDTPVTIEEAVQQAGADFFVAKERLIRVTEDEITRGVVDIKPNRIIKSMAATVRTDTDRTLGIVGADYGVVQNLKAFEFIRFISEVSGHKPKIETCGVLKNGARLFVTTRLGEDSFITPKDAITNYVVFTTTHDGSGAVMAFFTPVRVVCQNTLNCAIRGAKNKVVFKHTKYVDTRLDWQNAENRQKALEVFSKSVDFSAKFTENMLALKAEAVSKQDISDFAARVILDDAKFKLYNLAGGNVDSVDEISTRAKNQITALLNSVESGVGQDCEYKGTKLWLLNGLTTMLHNDTTYKSSEAEFEAMMDGTAAKRVQRGYDWLMRTA